MITLLLGEDDLSKQNFINGLASEQNSEVVGYAAGDNLPSLRELAEPVLFGPAKLNVFTGCLTKFSVEDVLVQADAKSNVIFNETSVDKRKKDTTAILKAKGVTSHEFPAPSGPNIITWINKHAEQLGGKLEKGAAEALSSAIVPEATGWPRIEPKLNVWQAHGEIAKLITYADGQAVTAEMVAELVPSKESGEVWEAINAFGERNRIKAFGALEKFYNSTSEDDKAKTIQLSALLADQFRNLLLVKDFDSRRIADDAVLKQTGWKSGRLFVLRKLSRGFTERQLSDILAKLENLDIELKTSTLPPRVVVDLILAQL
jgi:DNA polymerase III delta subunit